MNPANGGWLILLSLGVAMVMAVLHVPEDWPQWLGWLRPSWIALVVFFWVMELPHRLGLISAWVIGLAADILLADPLGLNGILLAGITYIAWRSYERLRMYSVFQQCGVVFFLVLGSELVRVFVQDAAWSRGWSWGVVVPPIMSMLAWPLVYVVLQRFRVQFRVE